MTASVFINVRLTPRGGANTVIGYRPADGVLLLRVKAAPVDGAANRACGDLVAETLGVKRAQVALVGGQTSRNKRFALTDLTDVDAEQVQATLFALPIAGSEMEKP